MGPTEAVLVCALELLGRSADSVPRIEVLEERPPGASVNAAAFVRGREGVIYLIASAEAFRVARSRNSGTTQCSATDELKMIASIIVHEEWHLKHGPDEEGAYYAQLMELARLGLGPDRGIYFSVKKAMQHVTTRLRRTRAAAAAWRGFR